jgi:hypothetical protein
MATRRQPASSTSPRRRTRKTVPVEPDPQAIARRAYELFLARGGAHGADIHDWLTAESELSRTTASGVPS